MTTTTDETVTVKVNLDDVMAKAESLKGERKMVGGVSLLDIHPSQALKNLADTIATLRGGSLSPYQGWIGTLDAASTAIAKACHYQATAYGNPNGETEKAPDNRLTICVYQTEPQASLGGDNVRTIIAERGPPDSLLMLEIGRRGVKEIQHDPRVRNGIGEFWWKQYIEPIASPDTMFRQMDKPGMTPRSAY